jgi:hypothetical protein
MGDKGQAVEKGPYPIVVVYAGFFQILSRSGRKEGGIESICPSWSRSILLLLQ